jgi:hypothetical protein
MSTETTRRQEAIGTDERISGPHLGWNKYGEPDHEYYRCERCGAESSQEKHLHGCC